MMRKEALYLEAPPQLEPLLPQMECFQMAYVTCGVPIRRHEQWNPWMKLQLDLEAQKTGSIA